jgi:hypothetical protein
MRFHSSCMSPCRSDYIFTDMIVGVWHVVSEDSDQLSTWLAVIHRLDDLSDCYQPTNREMGVHFDYPHALNELLEI